MGKEIVNVRHEESYIIATIIILIIIIIAISCPIVQNAEIETRKLKRGISSEDWIIYKQYNNF